MSQNSINILRSLQALKAVSAYKRIPEGYETYTFFGHNDMWNYVAVFDDRLCDECENYLEIGIFNGDKLRDVFQRLVIADENTIMLNVHPNCRCYLIRVIE